ncbi:MAG: DUF5615 family PIN-like protein [Anaerolineae bacterium]
MRQQTTAFLKKLGLDAVDTRDLDLQRATDQEIMQVAIAQDRILITYNSGFGDERRFPPGTHPGIIRLRVHPQTDAILHPILEKVFRVFGQKQLTGALVIVDNRRIRIKRKGEKTLKYTV